MKKAVNTVSRTAISILLITATGCSALMPSTQTLSVKCVPEDAAIKINGQKYTSPASVQVKRDRDVTLQFYKDGYSTHQQIIESHWNTTGKLDAVGGCFFILPWIGLLCPGSASLDETDVMVTLSPR